MKYIKLGILFFIWSCCSSYAEDRILMPQDIELFSFDSLFSSFPRLIQDYQSYFYGISGLIFTAALFRMLNESKTLEDQAMSLVKVAGGVGAMIACSTIISYGTDASEALAKHIGSDTYQTSEKLYNLAQCFVAIDFKLGAEEPEITGEENEIDPNGDGYGGLDEQISNIGFWDRLGSWFGEGLDSTKSFFQNPLGAPLYLIKRIFFVISSGLFFIVIMLCTFLIAIMDTTRTFLLCVSSLLLPIMIAGCYTKVFRSQSISYIFGVLGNILWPVGWAIGNLGILVLLEGFVSFCQSQLSVKKASELLRISTYPDSYNLSAEFIRKLMNLPFTSLCIVWLMLVVIAIWSIVVTFYGPRLIKKFVQTGADFFDSLSEGTTRVAGSAAGSVLTGVASGGAAVAGSALLKNGVGPGMSKAASALNSGAYTAGRMMNQGFRAHWDPANTANLFDGFKFINEYKSKFKK